MAWRMRRDWGRILFNPSFPYRLSHTLVASGLTVAFLVAGLSAYRWRRGETAGDAALTLRMGVRLAAVLIPLQILLGDLHGLNTLEHQPAKIAAMEAVWQTERGAPLVLFAVPDPDTRSNRFEIAHPQGRQPDPARTTPTPRSPGSTSSKAGIRRSRRCSSASASWWAWAC